MSFLSWVLGGMLFFIWSVIAFSLGVMGGRESARQEYYRSMHNVSKN